jgi:hypothetical protein
MPKASGHYDRNLLSSASGSITIASLDCGRTYFHAPRHQAQCTGKAKRSYSPAAVALFSSGIHKGTGAAGVVPPLSVKEFPAAGNLNTAAGLGPNL